MAKREQTEIEPTAEAEARALSPAELNGKGRAPLPARRVPSDDFEVVVNGEVYRPRAGEALFVSPTRTIAEDDALMADSRQREGEDPTAFWERLWATMTGRGFLLGWDWTDPRTGEPLPPPSAPQAYARLTSEENLYVVRVVLRGWQEPAPNA